MCSGGIQLSSCTTCTRASQQRSDALGERMATTPFLNKSLRGTLGPIWRPRLSNRNGPHIHLLDVHNGVLQQFPDKVPFPPYAILSHTWIDGEQGISNFRIRTRGLNAIENEPHKICGVSKQAKEDSYRYVWVGLRCVNQTDQDALAACILSMCRWYRNAGVCYVYLPDVEAGENPQDPLSTFYSSIWFTKG